MKKKRVERRRKGWIVDRAESTIRGGFINLFITLNILLMIWIGLFSKEVRENLVALMGLIVPFFAISFGVWRTGKYFDNRLEGGCNYEMVDTGRDNSDSSNGGDISPGTEKP